MAEDLSIIIPIYNTPVEDLERCFASVQALNGISYEAILIDDGSEERVSRFCKDFVTKNSHFRYYYQRNAGVACARNNGLKISQGRHITFLDSDDVIISNVIEKAISIENVDVIIFNMIKEEGSKKILWSAFEKKESSYISYAEAFKRIVYSSAINGCCGKIYKRELIETNGIRFAEGMVTGEDLYFVLEILELKPTIYYLSESGYRYLRKQSNTTNRDICFPLQTIKDIHSIMETSKRMVVTFEISQKEQLIDQLNCREVRSIFRWICNQISEKQFSKDKQTLAAGYIKSCSECLETGDFITRSLYKLIAGHRWGYIARIAVARKLYLRIKEF